MSFALQKLFSVRRSPVFILFLSVSVLLGLYLGSGLLCQCVQVHLIFWYPYFFIVDEVNYLNSQIFLLLLSVCLFVVFQLRVSLCILVCPGTHFVDKTGLRLTEIHLPLPPSAGIKDMHWTPFFLNRIYLCHFACPESQSAEQGSLTLAVTCLPWAPWSLRCFIISLSLYLAINLSISLLIFFFICFVRQGFSLALESVLDSDLVTAVPEAVRPLAGNPQSLCPGPSRGTTLTLSPSHNQGCRLHLRQA